MPPLTPSARPEPDKTDRVGKRCRAPPSTSIRRSERSHDPRIEQERVLHHVHLCVAAIELLVGVEAKSAVEYLQGERTFSWD